MCYLLTHSRSLSHSISLSLALDHSRAGRHVQGDERVRGVQPLSLSHTHTSTNTHTYSLSLSLSRSRSLLSIHGTGTYKATNGSEACTQTHTLSHTHTHSLSLTHTLSRSLSLSTILSQLMGGAWQARTRRRTGPRRAPGARAPASHRRPPASQSSRAGARSLFLSSLLKGGSLRACACKVSLGASRFSFIKTTKENALLSPEWANCVINFVDRFCQKNHFPQKHFAPRVIVPGLVGGGVFSLHANGFPALIQCIQGPMNFHPHNSYENGLNNRFPAIIKLGEGLINLTMHEYGLLCTNMDPLLCTNMDPN